MERGFAEIDDNAADRADESPLTSTRPSARSPGTMVNLIDQDGGMNG
jgi:hypothetical protein